MDKEDVINDFILNLQSVVRQHLPLVASPYLILISLQHIILPNLRTCACFAVTSVPRVASTAV